MSSCDIGTELFHTVTSSFVAEASQLWASGFLKLSPRAYLPYWQYCDQCCSLSAPSFTRSPTSPSAPVSDWTHHTLQSRWSHSKSGCSEPQASRVQEAEQRIHILLRRGWRPEGTDTGQPFLWRAEAAWRWFKILIKMFPSKVAEHKLAIVCISFRRQNILPRKLLYNNAHFPFLLDISGSYSILYF